MAESFRDLIAWQKSMALVVDVYRATESFEVQTQLEASYKLGYLATAEFDVLLEKASEVSRLLNGLIKNLQKQIAADGLRPPKS